MGTQLGWEALALDVSAWKTGEDTLGLFEGWIRVSGTLRSGEGGAPGTCGFSKVVSDAFGETSCVCSFHNPTAGSSSRLRDSVARGIVWLPDGGHPRVISSRGEAVS